MPSIELPNKWQLQESTDTANITERGLGGKNFPLVKISMPLTSLSGNPHSPEVNAQACEDFQIKSLKILKNTKKTSNYIRVILYYRELKYYR